MDKIIGLLSKANPNNESKPDDGTPWYMKYGSRALGIIGAFFCVLFGLWGCLSLITGNIKCLVSAILQICLGFCVMGVEAPFCCMFIDHVQTISKKVDERPLWNRAALYCIFAVIPVFLCPDLGSIFPCALVFGCGVIYGMMGLGKKASREEMAATAAQQQANKTSPGVNLVSNAESIGQTNPPYINTV